MMELVLILKIWLFVFHKGRKKESRGQFGEGMKMMVYAGLCAKD